MSSIWNNFARTVDRIGAMLGIRRENPDTPDTNTNANTINITNSGEQPVAYPTKPDDWQDASQWEKYWNLRVKYPQNFQDAEQYINSFTPAEVEIIMKRVHEEDCLMFTDSTYTKTTTTKIIGDINLFKKIAEIRQTLEIAQPAPILLEYVKLDYILESMPAQHHYSFKFVGVDTIYKS